MFLSSTMINEKYVIRMAVLSFRTKIATIDKAIDMIERCVAQTKDHFKI
jgi:aromatic-L-amino-acid/L-tryptophan decarboxylase